LTNFKNSVETRVSYFLVIDIFFRDEVIPGIDQMHFFAQFNELGFQNNWVRQEVFGEIFGRLAP
jgi:hypothetical protein